MTISKYYDRQQERLDAEEKAPLLQHQTRPVKTLDDLLREGAAKLLIGLHQQGHFETVERMLAEGATWDEIGKAITGHGPTVKQWYEMEKVGPPLDIPGILC